MASCWRFLGFCWVICWDFWDISGSYWMFLGMFLGDFRGIERDWSNTPGMSWSELPSTDITKIGKIGMGWSFRKWSPMSGLSMTFLDKICGCLILKWAWQHQTNLGIGKYYPQAVGYHGIHTTGLFWGNALSHSHFSEGPNIWSHSSRVTKSLGSPTHSECPSPDRLPAPNHSQIRGFFNAVWECWALYSIFYHPAFHGKRIQSHINLSGKVHYTQ